MRAMLPMPLWEGEGGGSGSNAGGAAAAAAAAAAAGGGNQGGGSGGQQQQQQSGGNTWTPPEGLTVPTEFMGTSAEDTLGKVLGGYSALNTRAEGLRTQLAAKPGAPEKPEGYTFKPGEKVAAYFPDPDKHAGIAAAKNVFHKHGVPQAAFEGIINDLYGGMAEAGTLAAPYDPKAEVASYAKVGGFDAATVSQHFQENVAFANGLLAQLTDLPPALAKEAEAELQALTDTAAGNALLRSLAGRMASGGIRIAGQGAQQGGVLSDADLDRLTADPRIDPNNESHKDPAQRFDKALYDQYTQGMARRGREKYGSSRPA